MVAARYPTVKQYVVMNEPNQPAFLRPQFRTNGTNASAAVAGAFLAAGYDALKAVDPTIRVVGLGLSPRGQRPPDRAEQRLDLAGAVPGRSRSLVPRERPRAAADGRAQLPPLPEPGDRRRSTRGYDWPNAGFVDLGRIKQAVWDAFRDTPQPTTVNGLRLYLDEVGWQVDTDGLLGYSGIENVAGHRRDVAGADLRDHSSAQSPAIRTSPR